MAIQEAPRLMLDDWADFADVKLRPVCAIDGEGITDADGSHRYTLLANSNHRAVEAHDLSTVQCLDFLLSLPHDELKVGFSINYDVNMWLRDIPLDHLRELLVAEKLYWKTYVIQYIPGKQFIVSDQHGRRSHIYDVFGFFQCSFVKALVDWKITDPTTVQKISDMKEKRGTFTDDDKRQVRAYCFAECDLLVDLMQRLIAATTKAEIPCRRWYGAGALAAGLLQKYGVKQYTGVAPLFLRDQILAGYYGGRFEIAASGDIGKVYTYDIKSAYPSVARSLPCLAHSQYKSTRQYSTDKTALWHVKWDVDAAIKWGPFPWRDDYFGIHYPSNGEGWYWDREVAAAMKLYPKGITAIEGLALDIRCEHKPFAFIDDVYTQRQALEAAGDFAHKTLKLALNSLYGKTAQSIGHGCKQHGSTPDKDCFQCQTAKHPPYQSYVWAGRITSGTRAQLLDAIRQNPDAIMSVATDSVVSTVPLNLPIGKQLGQWDAEEWEHCFLVQPGIYRLRKACPFGWTEERCIHESVRTRGFGKLETPFDLIVQAWQENPFGHHEYEATRFVGLAGAMAHKDYAAYWRKWIKTMRKINFYPNSRFIDVEKINPSPAYVRHDPPRFVSIYKSKPYTPKMTWQDSWSLDPELIVDMDQP